MNQEKITIESDVREGDKKDISSEQEKRTKAENLSVELNKDDKQEKKNKKIEPIIRAHHLDFIYNPGKGNEFHALKNISFDIYPEEFIIIFGPSGCGKSTLLNVIAGLETPDKGNIFVFNQDLTRMSARDFAVYHRKRIGMIYQQYNLITSLTVLENVVLPQVFVNVKKGRRKRWGRKLLKRFGIDKHADKIPTELSGGQQQRIGIARAIVNNPEIVLADEPVGNLDSKSAKLVLDILGDLNDKENKTIILVTHNPEYLDHADRILYMKDGVIEREVVNRKKKGINKIKKPETAVNKINELMRAYQGMTPEQINILIMPFKSKVFANHFISSRTMEEAKIFEDAIQHRMLGTISEEEFFIILNKPFTEGGVGFDKRTAKKIIRRINRVSRIAYYVYQEGHQHHNELGDHKKITFEEKAKKVTIYLYKTCYHDYYHHLSGEQNERVEKAVKDRLETKIDKNIFYDILDRSVNDDGVGLNSKTAKAISEELELILILGFGVVSISEKIASMSKKEREIEKSREEGEDAPMDVAEEIEKEEELQKEGSQSVPSPGEILNQMESQLKEEIKNADDENGSSKHFSKEAEKIVDRQKNNSEGLKKDLEKENKI